MHTRYPLIDYMRALAALAVLGGHVRALSLSSYNQLDSPNILQKMFYFLTGFGHQAVIIFFVISGFLIGRSIWFKYEKNQWSWIDFSLARFTRLWIVLFPALVLT